MISYWALVTPAVALVTVVVPAAVPATTINVNAPPVPAANAELDATYRYGPEPPSRITDEEACAVIGPVNLTEVLVLLAAVPSSSATSEVKYTPMVSPDFANVEDALLVSTRTLLIEGAASA